MGLNCQVFLVLTFTLYNAANSGPGKAMPPEISHVHSYSTGLLQKERRGVHQGGGASEKPFLVSSALQELSVSAERAWGIKYSTATCRLQWLQDTQAGPAPQADLPLRSLCSASLTWIAVNGVS